MSNWIFGVLMGVLSLIGLFLASRAHDQMFYVFGLVLFVFGVLVVFWLVHQNTGHPKGERQNI
jgi:hypothetical protein